MDQPAIRFNVNYTTGSEDLKGATSLSIHTASACVLCNSARLTERWDDAYRSSREGEKNPTISTGITFMSKFLKIGVAVLKLKHADILSDITIHI